MRSRPLLVLFLALVVVGMGQSFLFALLPPLGRVLGLGEVQIGLIITSSAVVFFFTSPVWGRLSDSLGRQPVIAIGLAGYGVTMLLFTFVIQLQLWGRIAVGVAYPLLVLSRSGYAAVASAVFPGAQAFIAESTSPSRSASGRDATGRGCGPPIGASSPISSSPSSSSWSSASPSSPAVSTSRTASHSTPPTPRSASASRSWAWPSCRSSPRW